MSNTLLIHIGMPKTGTTALQNFLLINNESLKKYGWCYPIIKDNELDDLGRWEIKSSGNGYAIYDSWIINHMKSEWDKGMEILFKFLKEKNVIISAENIYEIGMVKFIADVKEKYGNVKVVVYLRRQDRAIESLYNQRIKSGIEYNTFEGFIDSDAVPENFLQYAMKLDSISEIVGKENLIVRIYEKQQLKGNDTITDFLSILGITLDQDEWKKEKSTNLAIGGNYLEIYRLINSIQSIDGILDSKDGIWSWSDWEVKSDFQNILMRISHSLNQDNTERGFFTTYERKKFLERFASDNEVIAREYLHREDGILFYDKRMDFPLFDINQSSGFEADIIRFFAAMIYAQDQRFRRLLEKKSNELSGRLFLKEILRRRKGRQLLFWGAGHNCRKLFDALGAITGVSIVDNDVSKRGSCLHGIQVKHVGDVINWGKYFIVVTCEITNEIEEQLCDLGLTKEEDYVLMREYTL